MSNGRLLLSRASLLCSLLALGCETRDPVEVSTESTSIRISSELDYAIDWTPVQRDYDGTMFCVTDIAIDKTRLRTLGVLPSLDRYTAFCQGGYAHHVDAVLLDGKYYNSWLFLREEGGSLSGVLVRDLNPPVSSSTITFEEVEARLAPLPLGNVYIEPRFAEELGRAGVKLPSRYVNLPVLYWDSVNHREANP